jgi:hypothetical protein
MISVLEGGEYVAEHSILWRRLDQPEPESAIFAHDGSPCRLDYQVRCDAEWQTLSSKVEGRVCWSLIVTGKVRVKREGSPTLRKGWERGPDAKVIFARAVINSLS